MVIILSRGINSDEVSYSSSKEKLRNFNQYRMCGLDYLQTFYMQVLGSERR